MYIYVNQTFRFKWFWSNDSNQIDSDSNHLNHLVCLFHWNACWTQTAKNSRLHWSALPSLSSFSTGFLSLSSLSRKYQSSVAREEERGVFYLHLVECWRLQDLQEVMKPLQLCLAARLGTMCKWQYSMIASHLFFCNRAVTKLQWPSSQPASFCQRVLLIAPHFAAMDLCISWSHKNPEVGTPSGLF